MAGDQVPPVWQVAANTPPGAACGVRCRGGARVGSEGKTMAPPVIQQRNVRGRFVQSVGRVWQVGQFTNR